MVRGSIDASSDDAHSGAPAKRSTQNDNALCCALAEDDGMLRKARIRLRPHRHHLVLCPFSGRQGAHRGRRRAEAEPTILPALGAPRR